MANKKVSENTGKIIELKSEPRCTKSWSAPDAYMHHIKLVSIEQKVKRGHLFGQCTRCGEKFYIISDCDLLYFFYIKGKV